MQTGAVESKEERENGEKLCNEYGVSFESDASFGTRQKWWLCNVANELNATELFTF
jgi:hypothetical protein